MELKKTVLDSGLTVITDSFDSVRSVATGVWFNVGSRDERPEQAGMAHFMEHMAFKGTPTRDAFQISEAFDRLGAQQNAFTSREVTCYHAKCIDESLGGVVELLGDMVQNSVLDQTDCELEREVIIEELHRAEDDPEDVAGELFLQSVWPASTLGLPIGGTPATVGTFDSAAGRAFHAEHYHASNCFITAAGNLDHDAFVAMVEEQFAAVPRSATARPNTSSRPVPAPSAATRTVRARETEQAHIFVGATTMGANDDRRPALGLASAILGGSSSSRLFREVREKLGLVYAIYSFPQLFTDAGVFGIYAGTRPENAARVLELIEVELGRLASGDITSDELELARSATRGNLAMGLESTTTRMRRLGENHYLRSSMVEYEESLARIEAVTLEDVRAIGVELGSTPMVVTAVGPVDDALNVLGEQSAASRVL